MKRFALLLVSGLLASAASAQTTPTNSPTTTRSTNTVGLGGTVNGTPTSSDAATGMPARYDDRNSGLPSGQVKMKTGKTKQAKAVKKQPAM
ncbi:MAG: hypothetical protein ACRYFZ_19965 [Janthinobacterium lividum]